MTAGRPQAAREQQRTVVTARRYSEHGTAQIRLAGVSTPTPDPDLERLRSRTDLRDRRGRGPRGPGLLPSPLAPSGVPASRTRSERFDALAVAVLDDIEQRWEDRMPPVDLAVEEIPVIAADWQSPRVPLGSLVPATATSRARIVLFRRPIEHRAEGPAELAAVILAVLVDQVADLLGVPPAEVHPDYPAED